ncbi:MAG: ergothioneine biosynthesis protein EgtB [Pirellulaceae bacterium]
MSTNTAADVIGVERAGDAASRYRQVRDFTESLCATLEVEDCVVQSMPDVSPTRWHLAHTTWFFETFLLRRFATGYKPYDSAYEVLFNSYYNTVGPQFPRAQRGLLSRPTVRQVHRYRQAVDEQTAALLRDPPGENAAEILRVLEIGLHHEQQHQELMLTDIKHVLSCNPLFPVFRSREAATTRGNGKPAPSPQRRPPGEISDWHSYEEGLFEFGHDGQGFAFDNEGPRHQQFLADFELADRLVTNGQYQAFVEDGGYRRPQLWLSAGWAQRQSESWESPLYWHRRDGQWLHFTLNGLEPIDADQPVCHVSYFEADAFARWAAARLPRELEWEHAADPGRIETGNFVESGALRPTAAGEEGGFTCPRQMFGDVWEWTASPYAAYPGYRPPVGALGEYNGKFMCNQYVLRGGSCATSRTHIRPTYRNFFPPDARWQFSGIRLARDLQLSS